ncbi:Major facilitator superfamily domain general substrate transporter [Penicillium cf. griseofulvum]|uniref:Major facilitator superfamily domain general substrate transporter n=1 Tax=Penicillium cf. griseofulvum TaxID=2972120 RepID=A0A9W9MFH5_9EURO|nr:Major facilitator superfamily domain general substrate transporter [Penicillium cf. griseofulvum]
MEHLPAHHEHEDVPGTILLVDIAHDSNISAQRKGIVLQPQPSTDPNDPLNRSQRWKNLNVGMVCLYTFAIGICTAAQFSIMTQISESQRVSLADLNLGTGLMQLMQGWANLLWQPVAMTYGRRPVYLVTIIFSIGPVLWVPLAHGASQWYAHRILLGVFCSSVESLPELSVQDLFFAHERGNYMALYTFVLFGSNFIAPFLAGFIADGLNWKWVMYLATIFLGICALILFFFMEDTIYFRNTTESGAQRYEIIPPDDNGEPGTLTAERLQTGSASTLGENGIDTGLKPRRRRLALATILPGRPTHKQMALKSWQSIKIPFFFPNILWCGLLYGSNLALYSVINATMSSILGSSPYNFPPTMVGVSYLSPFVFGGAASIWAGKMSDALAIKLAKRNGGVREPEHRLWGLLLSAPIAAGGLLMWGVGASHGAHYMVLVIGIGITTFGVVCASAISLAYAVDCFKEMAGESFVSINIIRNTIGFGFSYAITPWIEAVGLRNCFISVSLISFFCTYTFLGVIIWGKTWRRTSAERYWQFVAKKERWPTLSSGLISQG